MLKYQPYLLLHIDRNQSPPACSEGVPEKQEISTRENIERAN